MIKALFEYVNFQIHFIYRKKFPSIACTHSKFKLFFSTYYTKLTEVALDFLSQVAMNYDIMGG